MFLSSAVESTVACNGSVRPSHLFQSHGDGEANGVTMISKSFMYTSILGDVFPNAKDIFNPLTHLGMQDIGVPVLQGVEGHIVRQLWGRLSDQTVRAKCALDDYFQAIVMFHVCIDELQFAAQTLRIEQYFEN